jgi:hypothetical protein
MEKIIKEFCGRAFSPEDIEIIQWTVKAYPKLSRAELAKTICEFLDWKQMTGKPKESQCTSLLIKLQANGLIELPPLQLTSQNIKAAHIQKTTADRDITFQQDPVNGACDEFKTDKGQQREAISECGALELVPAKTPEEHKQWRTYVQQYHTLGYSREYGARMQYFIRSEGRELGCIQFSACAWALAPREQWIGWTTADKKKYLQLIVNNSRFLVLPWVRVKNLGSRVLSQAARRLPGDWLKMYCYEPVLLETFVDTARYAGTCYKAANWRLIGQTKGRGRYDRFKEYGLSAKDIYMYPLRKDFREILKGEKPFKAVTPDE